MKTYTYVVFGGKSPGVKPFDWEEVKPLVIGVSGVRVRRFNSYLEAWIAWQVWNGWPVSEPPQDPRFTALW
jgi:hypothetical protein